MKTFANQTTDNIVTTLPFNIMVEFLSNLRKNPKCTIHLIETFFDNGVKQRVTYHYT